MAEFLKSSVFRNITQHIQLIFDEASKLHKQLFDTVIFENYLDWDTPTKGLDFNAIIGKYGITIAAATIGENSKEPIIGSAAPALFAQRVLNHALTKKLDGQTYREILQLQDDALLDDKTKTQELIKLMFGDVSTVVNGVLARLDMIFLQALSNEGVATFDNTTNPEGGVKDIIDYKMPESNKLVSSTPWTDEVKDTIDVFQYIDEVLKASQDKVVFTKMLVDVSLLNYICSTAKVKQTLWGSDKSASLVTPTDLNNYLTQKGFPVFEPIRRLVNVQNNGSYKTLKPWNAQRIVFVPDGKLGQLKNAYADNELHEEPNCTYANYGRVRVSKWATGDPDGSNVTEFTKAQVYALPVFNQIEGIYSLNTQYEPSESSAVSPLTTLASTASTKTSSSKKK